MANNLGIASVSITIVTHYRPHPNYCENTIFNFKKSNANYKVIYNKTYESSKACVPNVCCKYQEILTLGY